MSATEWARRVASKRKVTKKICPVCETEFEGIATASYCSDACRIKAWREKKRALKEKPS